MKRNTPIMIVGLVAVIMAFAAFQGSDARSGGMSPANYTIGNCNCHAASQASTASIAAVPSTTTPSPGQQITISVTASGGQQTTGQPLAVLLNTAANALPSADGWTIVSDPSGTTAYDFYQIAWASPHTFVWTVNAPSTAGTHTLNVYVLHGGGLEYRGSTTASVTITAAAVPSITFNTPAASSVQSGTSMSVSATINPGTSALQSVTLAVDGTAIAPSQTVTNPSWTVDTTLFTNAAHTLTISAISTAGTGTATRSVTFSNPGPTVSITSPTSGSTVSGTITVAVSATPLPGSTMGSVAIRVDSGASISLSAAPYTYQLDTAGLSVGAHTITATATDNLGRIGSGQSQITVSNQGPSVSITQPSAGSSLSGTVTVSTTVTPGPASSVITQVVLSVDGTAVQTLTVSPYTFSLDTLAYANGAHALMVKATDASLNTGSQTVNVAFANGVIATPPSVQISSPTEGQTLTGATTIDASVTAGTNIISYVTLSIDGIVTGNKTTGPFTFALDTSNYVNGSHIVNVTAHDSADLQGYRTVSVTFSNTAAAIPALGLLEITQQTGSTQVSISVTGAVSYLTLSVDGSIIRNKTVAPYSFIIDTTALSDGPHTLNVTVVGPGGRASTESVITISNGVPQPTGSNLAGWEATMIGGSLLLIGGVMFLVASVLMLRRSKMRRLK